MPVARFVLGEGFAALAFGLHQVEGRALRIGDHCHMAHAVEVIGSHEQLAALVLQRGNRAADIVNRDIADPRRARAALLHLFAQLHHADHFGACHAADPVIDIRRAAIGKGPADQRFVESLRGIRVRGHQLVPHEIALGVGHGHAPLSSATGANPPKISRLPSNGMGFFS